MRSSRKIRAFISRSEEDHGHSVALERWLSTNMNMKVLLYSIYNETDGDIRNIDDVPDHIIGDIVFPIISGNYLNNNWLRQELTALLIRRKEFVCPIIIDSTDPRKNSYIFS